MTGGSSPIRIIAVDDHPVVRDGIAGLVEIETEMTLVAQAAEGDVHVLRALKAGAQGYLANTLHVEL